MAVVTVANISGTTDYTNLALTHIIPAGWEIFNERMAGQITTSAPYSYQDIRDDRILTYFNLQQGQAKTFTVRLQATYAGDFVMPAIQCEAMYDENEQARKQQDKKEGVTISTLHAVKGLEYDIVYILNVNEGSIPYRKAVLAEAVEEERRLFYVGMTRAKKKLVLAYVKRQYEKEREPSRFLEETGL